MNSDMVISHNRVGYLLFFLHALGIESVVVADHVSGHEFFPSIDDVSCFIVRMMENVDG